VEPLYEYFGNAILKYKGKYYITTEIGGRSAHEVEYEITAEEAHKAMRDVKSYVEIAHLCRDENRPYTKLPRREKEAKWRHGGFGLSIWEYDGKLYIDFPKEHLDLAGTPEFSRSSPTPLYLNYEISEAEFTQAKQSLDSFRALCRLCQQDDRPRVSLLRSPWGDAPYVTIVEEGKK
jgi:hypothetical protein